MARRHTLIGALAVTAGAALIWLFMCLKMDLSPFGGTPYDTYTLQAMAWRRGMVSLGQDYPWLELAVYGGDWYVSFPPVPTVPIWLLTFIFGADTPDNAVVKVYALGAMLGVYMALRTRKMSAPSAALAALSVGFCGSAMALSMHGAVWYQAQMAALCCMGLALWLTLSGRITWGLLLYALSVGCRPFNALYGPLLMFVWWRAQPARDLRATARGLWKGVALGLCVAGALAAYNVARFGDPFEFGTNYLPEFMRSQYGEFSLNHLPGNIVSFVFGLPFDIGADGTLSLKRFGFSLLIANPLLLLPLWRCARDLFTRRMTAQKALCIALMLAQMLLLLLHRTFGGLQFGARYAVDLLPYAALYLALDDDRRLHGAEWCLLIVGIVLTVPGVLAVHI